MKKRILSAALAAVLTLSFMMPSAFAAQSSVSPTSPNLVQAEKDYNEKTRTTTATYIDKVVIENKGKQAGQTNKKSGTAYQIQANITTKSGATGQDFSVIVLDRANYTKVFGADALNVKAIPVNGTGPIQAGFNYSALTTMLKDNDGYGVNGKGTGGAGATTLLTILGKSLSGGAASITAYTPRLVDTTNLSGTKYFSEYYYIVADSGNKTDNTSYYVDKFYMDSEGFVYDEPSYMLYYNGNKAMKTDGTTPAGGSVVNMPSPQQLIAYGNPATTTLSAATPKLPGYLFQGWGAAANTATADALTEFTPVPFAVGGIYAVHAIWKLIEVKHQIYGATADILAGTKTYVGNSGQVGEPYVDKNGALDTNGYHTLSAGDSTSGRTYTVTGASVVTKDVDNAEVLTPVAVGKLQNGLPAGLYIGTSGNTKWKLSGTPTWDSANPIRFTVQVTDNNNGSSDTITYTIPSLIKGSRPAPELDWNTALQGRALAAENAEENPDGIGQIIGFYSPNKGATNYNDGQYTYEFIPKVVFGAKVDALTGATAGSFAAMGSQTQAETLATLTTAQKVALDSLWQTVTTTPAPDAPVLDWGKFKQGTVANAPAPAPEGSQDWVRSDKAGTANGGQDETKGMEVNDLDANTEYLVRFKATETYMSSKYKVVATGALSGNTVDPTKYIAAVFFDWDNTLLGAVTIPMGSTDEEVAIYVKDFEAAAAPLKGKLGYDFVKWLNYHSTVPTHWGKYVDGANSPIGGVASVDSVLPEPGAADSASFAGLNSTIIVKAGYKSNDNLVFFPDQTNQMPYTTTTTDIVREGASFNFAFTVEVTRGNVMRMVVPVLNVSMVTKDTGGGATTIVQMIPMGNSDVENVTFYGTSTIEKVNYSLVDGYSLLAKTAGGARAAVINEAAGTPAAMDGFLWLGTRNMISDNAAAGNMGNITAIMLRDANLFPLPAGVNVAKAAANIQNALRELHKTSPEARLNYKEMKYAMIGGFFAPDGVAP